MWLLPTAYCFALQAGGIANDLPAAIFALAAFDYGLRWKKSRNYEFSALSITSAALMTAVKPTTLPLLLPYVAQFIQMSLACQTPRQHPVPQNASPSRQRTTLRVVDGRASTSPVAPGGRAPPTSPSFARFCSPSSDPPRIRTAQPSG